MAAGAAVGSSLRVERPAFAAPVVHRPSEPVRDESAGNEDASQQRKIENPLDH